MKSLAILFTVFILVVSAGAQSSSEKAKTSNAIEKVMKDQTAAWNRGDIEGFMSGYWKSEKMAFVSGDKVTYGWQQTLDNYKRNYSTKELMGQLTFSDLKIDVLSSAAAFVIGSWSLAREKDNPHGKFTLLFRKFKDGWRIVTDHTS